MFRIMAMNFGRPPLALSMAVMLFCAAITTQAAEFGTAEEAKAMLDKAVAAMKEDEGKALAMFNNGESGFKDRDLYVLCANASDTTMGQNSQTSHPAKR
jgi:hypothetical protein